MFLGAEGLIVWLALAIPHHCMDSGVLALRLWTWVEMEYHHQAHSSLSGRTPLEVWESDADQIRWVEDHSQLEQSFYGEVERLVRNDSTVQWRGMFYEVPPYLRRQRVRLRYALLDATHFSVLDGGAEIPLRRVDPVGYKKSNVLKTRGKQSRCQM